MNNESIKEVMHILGGRRTQIPRYINERAPVLFNTSHLSRHSFTFRVDGTLIGWFEVWCDHEAVIAYKNTVALEIARLGFGVCFLSTRFSVRDVGKRRPCLVTPIESGADLQEIQRQLEVAGYTGPKIEER